MVRVDGRDNARVELERRSVAHPGEAAVFENPDKDLLRRLVEVGDIVDQQRAAFCLLENAGDRLAAVLPAEQRLLGVALGDRGCREPRQGTVGPPAQRMHVTGKRTAAGARLPADQHAAVVFRELLYPLAQALHQLAATDRRQQTREYAASGSGLLASGVQRRLDRSQ